MTKPYSRVQLFSGGGSRFGYYLGSYAALCQLGVKPDLILATCGGSLAALLVNIAPDPDELIVLSQSRELYQVVCASRSSSMFQGKSKPKYFSNALKRFILSRYPAKLTKLQLNESSDKLLNELNDLAMFEITNESAWLDRLHSLNLSSHSSFTSDALADNTSPDIAIIASRLVANEHQCSAAKLQQLLFAPTTLATIKDSHGQSLASSLYCPSHKYAPHRLLPEIHTVYNWDIKQAVRASMADMYYLQPTYIDDLGWCLGGVIDLTPIELVCQLGTTVFAETKANYDKWLAAPAILRVFGFDPNARLQAVHNYPLSSNSQQQHIHWLPFADNGQALAGQHVSKRLKLRTRTLELIHADYEEFTKQMQSQWDYGFQRTLQYLQP